MKWLVVVVAVGCGGSSAARGAPAPAPVPPSAPLIPLDPHDSWTYTIGEGSSACTRVDSVRGTMLVDDRMATIVRKDTTCPKGETVVTLYIAESGETIETRAETDVDWLRLDPPADGHSWNAAETGSEVDYTWHRAGDTTVPAGTFGECWIAETMPNGGDEQFTYCRAVGLVAIDNTNAGGTVTKTVLMTKSF